ncbi:radical SAM protein [Pelomicrobium methylotrophicum]|uniref:Radical SAM protein n=1 Tax=Pelomicrobium methylotrophicum TaxID=2602750 RepID=A0A5C7EVH7_9PROT|nr:radical SAM protein [Pelomicrobium methylotrophicum]TXF12105.1 radical SAM protein [Pelomicrobium methylotrophicum]
MTEWLRIVERVEALEDLDLDPDLVERMQRRYGALSGERVGTINFYTPTFKAFSTSEIAGCGKNAWPAVSITGGECKLACDHCKAKILEPMIPARTPEALWRVVNEAIAAGARGMLLTGGSNHRNEVEYGPFYPVIRRIKDTFPGFKIAMHTALVDRDIARRMEDSGIDAAMMDVIGAQDTIRQVYHLRRGVEDFEASLACLTETSLKVVPHIVIGLHYGRLLGEWNALEMLKRHTPDAVVLVVVMPFYAPAHRPFATPDPREVGAFFMDAREALPDTPLLLGCARPAGRLKAEIDTYAVLAGLNGIAHPSDGMVELAVRLGRGVRVTPTCCSIAVGDEVLALEEETVGLQVDVERIIEHERRRRERAPTGRGLAGIKVVATAAAVEKRA